VLLPKMCVGVGPVGVGSVELGVVPGPGAARGEEVLLWSGEMGSSVVEVVVGRWVSVVGSAG
jgi:hypothetical protein